MHIHSDYFMPADYGSCVISYLPLKGRDSCFYGFCLFGSAVERIFYFKMKERFSSCQCCHQNGDLASELLSTLEPMPSVSDGRLFNGCDVIGFGFIPSLRFKGFVLPCFLSLFSQCLGFRLYLNLSFNTLNNSFRSLLSLWLSLKLGKILTWQTLLYIFANAVLICLCVP